MQRCSRKSGRGTSKRKMQCGLHCPLATPPSHRPQACVAARDAHEPTATEEAVDSITAMSGSLEKVLSEMSASPGVPRHIVEQTSGLMRQLLDGIKLIAAQVPEQTLPCGVDKRTQAPTGGESPPRQRLRTKTGAAASSATVSTAENTEAPAIPGQQEQGAAAPEAATQDQNMA